MSVVTALAVFTAFIVGLLLLDLTLFRRGSAPTSIRAATLWSGFYVLLALAFSLGIYLWRGPEAWIEFLTGYFLEQSLSLDNLFVFVLIFGNWSVKPEFHHRILLWVILGALATSAALVAAGLGMLAYFAWAMEVMGAFLVFSGARMAIQKPAVVNPESNLLLRFVRRVFPVTASFEGGAFFLTREGRRFATPLFLVLVLVESADVVFAMDSIPAIFGVTRDPFIVYTATCFGMLGLRALYSVVSQAVARFQYFRHGIAVLLMFVGAKMLLTRFVHIPVLASLIVILVVVGASVILSLAKAARKGTPA